MKKVLLGIVMVASSAVAGAQGFKVGIKGGADLHKISGQAFKDQFSFGYHLGGFADIGLSKKFSLSPEVYFSQVNVDTSSQFSQVYEFNNINEVKLQYINIPLMLSYKPNNFVALQAGPQFGILIDQNSNMLENGQEAFKSGDFSMVGGVQLNISKIRIYGRYVVGLNNINDIDNRDKWKSQTVHLGLGLTL